MKEITIQELVNALQGKTIRVGSADIYGISISFLKAQIDYDENMGILTFGAGNYNTPDGTGSVGICIDDIVEAITLDDDGSYTIEFNQYMADINIEISDI